MEIARAGEQIQALEREQVSLRQSVEQLRQVKQSIERAADNLSSLAVRHETVLTAAGLSFSDIVSLRLDYSSLDTAIGQRSARLTEIEALLLDTDDVARIQPAANVSAETARQAAAERSFRLRRSALEDEKRELVERLGKPAREYQEYLAALAVWMHREQELRGNTESAAATTLLGLERELNRVATEFPSDLAAARTERTRLSKEIFEKRRALTQFYRAVKESIDGEIAKCRQQLGDYDISIEAGLRFNPSFFDEFLKFINLAAVGSFRGQEEGRAMLRQLTDVVSDWQDEGQVISAVNAIADALHVDQRQDVSASNARRDVFKQMKGQRSPQELYDYLFGFEYLQPKYDLKVDDKDLSELSPGERGGLLLIFYLMLDRQEIPLIIDQPEDNLDNRSVYEILVTFIKQARRRRQIILVTHNPNLAVVADAEQIILVSIDKKQGRHDFDFYSGSIEEPRINQALVDILEGTLPAFDNRRLKYRRQIRATA